ncbi:pimeloyl-ACP methyl ester carboxylesterase [Lewinella marina]|uniref:Alpha/beta hydrolase n=1 Tax=Neolewinella marina TaxID=438751 RepID=A0A2G0CEK1_9BACT|nr:alpha/beta fold hydrolase [Neolewinella marina]NJB87265.1 pimeloyl-ACP methyl ester carboxylesterase [Neolewinella marina]PHK98411.1 alpha/beta hydrolase [Neolewinella marina]
MQLNYKTYGEGFPLVILHGLFGNLDNWQTLARQWAGHYRVILVDLRNHGRSPHADEMSYPLMAHDLAAFLEEQSVDRCHLLGHSMGGKVAMQTALTYPALVEKLIVVDMAPRQYGRGHDDVFAALHALDPASLEDRREADERMRPHMEDAGVRQFLLKNLARDNEEGFRWRMNLEVLHRDYDNLIAPVGTLGQHFPGQALFVRGGKSGYVHDEDWDGIQALFPLAELATVADAGHWIHAERPRELLSLIQAFLEKPATRKERRVPDEG